MEEEYGIDGAMRARFGRNWRAWFGQDKTHKGMNVEIGSGGAGYEHIVAGYGQDENSALQSAVDAGYWQE